MKKRIYRATNVKSVNCEALTEQVKDEHLIVGVDIAKSKQFASLMLENKECLGLVKWDQLKAQGNEPAMELLGALAGSAASADLVMEPSGTYGDPLRHRARSMGYRVHRISPKRSRDYAEVFDGVPSRHDGKSAMLLGRLHLEEFSEPWQESSPSRRDLSALVREADIHQGNFTRNLGRLEGWAARHWPELHCHITLSRVTVLELLARYGCPRQVVRAGSQAVELMRRIGGPALKETKIELIMESARDTIGILASEGEKDLVRAIAGELLRSRKCLSEVEKRIQSRCEMEPSIAAMSPVLGVLTAVVLFVEIGDPRDFPNARSYLKAAGLNLKEHSSGLHVGRLTLSKRGSGIARRWLYMAVLRLIQKDRVTKAWYEKKVHRDGGRVKKKALIAVMRKLSSALWHVAKGEIFDSSKLFNVDCLGKPVA